MTNGQKVLPVTQPAYDKTRVRAGIVHFGPSHFARAHWFRIVDDYMSASGDLDWGIVAVNIQSKKRVDNWPRYQELRDRQGGSYHLYEQGLESEDSSVLRRIDSLIDIIPGTVDANAVAEAIANPDIKLITSTVTQKGYDVTTDMSDPTMAYYIVRGLEQRYRRGLPAPTIMSLDNLPNNGTRLRDAVILQAAGNPDLEKWIIDNGVFPTTMVDRITPTTRLVDCASLSQRLGVQDVWPVCTEEFLQLVVARQPGCTLPPIDTVSKGLTSVQFTPNVHAHELMKIRMLNGTHMALGVVGQLMGYKDIFEALSDPRLKNFAEGFMTQAASSLTPLEGVSYDEYQKNVFRRFVRLSPPDDLSRLSRNGSTDKLDARVLATARDLIAQGQDFRMMAFTAAAWAHFLKGYNVKGEAFDINDTSAIQRGWQEVARTKPAGQYIGLLGDIFGQDLARKDGPFNTVFRRYYNIIASMGIGAALNTVAADTPVSRILDFRAGMHGPRKGLHHG